MKQKGQQYTLSLFVSTILICISFFSMCFNAVGIGSIYFEIEQQPYDFAILTAASDDNIEAIRNIAQIHNINIQDFNFMDFLVVGREAHYGDSTSWAYEYITNETSFEGAIGTKLDVAKGTCTPLSIEKDTPLWWENGFAKLTKMYISASSKEESFVTNDVVKMDGVLNSLASATKSFIVLNDEDFYYLSNEVDDQFNFYYLFFNANNIGKDNLNLFLKDVIDLNLQFTNGMILSDYLVLNGREDWYKEVIPGGGSIPYKGNEIYAMREWNLYPFAREAAVDRMFESGAVYLILVAFISLIAFIISTMIVGLKITQTLWQDRENYIIAKRLGMRMNHLKQLITKQIAFIFFYPMIVGLLISGILGYLMFKLLDMIPAEFLLILIVSLGVVLIIIQLTAFVMFKSKMVKNSGLNAE